MYREKQDERYVVMERLSMKSVMFGITAIYDGLQGQLFDLLNSLFFSGR